MARSMSIPKPDRTMRLSELRRDSFVYRIAAAMIARHGFYTFTDCSNGGSEKVMVLA